ncbi:CylJ protein [Streptococcus sp. 45]|uniref:glycosyltransferase n=1 Tax=Streptococcus sp. 45 TaxID=1855326 RepID=UPI0008BD1290|nr:glycosyltransferase [Streptococcus sp. 45]SEI79581.1 CylJ protein [Streptococcus sp. 45]
MSKFLFAPFMMNLGESQRLSKLADHLWQKGHEIHIIGNSYYPFIFNNAAYTWHHCSADNAIYNKERYDFFFSLSTDFNFLTEDEIEMVCDFERKLLRQESFDAVVTGYRLSMVTSCRLEETPLIWIISGATHISEIVENSEGLFSNNKYFQSTRRRSQLNQQQMKKTVEKMITSYSSNVSTWNTYLKKNGGVPFNNALELFKGNLNLVADYSKFYDFPDNSTYKTIGPILIDDVGFSSHMEKETSKILLSFGTSFKKEWVEEFLTKLPKNRCYLLTTCGRKIKLPGSHIQAIDFLDFSTLDSNIEFSIIHGGQGTVYAMAAQGIPFIGIPFFNEQFWNIKKFSKKQAALLLENPTAQNLTGVISDFTEHLTDYKQNMLALTHQIKEEAQHSLEKAEAEIAAFISQNK